MKLFRAASKFLRFRLNEFDDLLAVAKDYLIKIFQDTNLLAENAKRVTSYTRHILPKYCIRGCAPRVTVNSIRISLYF